MADRGHPGAQGRSATSTPSPTKNFSRHRLQINDVGHNDRPRQGSKTGPGHIHQQGNSTMTKINMRAAVPLCAAALSVVGSLVLGAAPAHADTDDSEFLNAVRNYGITDSAGNQALINLGHMMCNLLGDGYSTNALVDVGELHASKLSAGDVKFLVQSAEAAYCPEYIW